MVLLLPMEPQGDGHTVVFDSALSLSFDSTHSIPKRVIGTIGRSLTGYAFGPSPFGKAGVFFLHRTVQPGFGSERMTGVPSVRNCQKPPPGPTEPKPAGSWEDPVLAMAKADPIRDSRSCSLRTLTCVGEVHKKLQSTASTRVVEEKIRDLGNYRLVSLASGPKKIKAQIFQDIMLRHMEYKEVIGDSQHGLTKGQIMPVKPGGLLRQGYTVVDKGRVTDIIYLNLCKVFHTVPSSSLNWKDVDHSVDKELARCS
ncbi:hypothetical protein TURU_033322 [Turdus rufiventris]|nr:hypothetical protein TURU_033322 [Turdus rufiventris]